MVDCLAVVGCLAVLDRLAVVDFLAADCLEAADFPVVELVWAEVGPVLLEMFCH